MSKRLLVVALSAIGILGIPGAAMADSAERERRDWACIAVHDLEQGVCQRNPLPDRLPIPDDSTVPEVEAEAPELPELPEVEAEAPEASSVSAPSAPSIPSL